MPFALMILPTKVVLYSPKIYINICNSTNKYQIKSKYVIENEFNYNYFLKKLIITTYKL